MSRTQTYLTLARAIAGVVGTRSFHFSPDDPITDPATDPEAAAAAAANAAHDAAEKAKADAAQPPADQTDEELANALLAANGEKPKPKPEAADPPDDDDEDDDDADEDDEDDEDDEPEAGAGGAAGGDTVEGDGAAGAAAAGDTVAGAAATDTLAGGAGAEAAGAPPAKAPPARSSRYEQGLKLTQQLQEAIRKVNEDELMPDGQKAAETARLQLALADHEEKQQDRYQADVDDDWKQESAKHGLPIEDLRTMWKDEGAKLLQQGYQGRELEGALKYAFGLRVAAAKATRTKPGAKPGESAAPPASGKRVEPPAARTPITAAGARVAPPASTIRPQQELTDEDELLQTQRRVRGGIRSLIN